MAAMPRRWRKPWSRGWQEPLARNAGRNYTRSSRADLTRRASSISTRSNRCSARSLPSRNWRARNNQPGPGSSPAPAHIWALETADDRRPALFSDHADLLRQRLAASRPCLHDGGLRCAGAVYAARRSAGQISDRNRRAWPESGAISGGRGRLAARIRRPQLGAVSRRGGAVECPYDEFIRTTEPRHTRAVQALWQELDRRGEIYLGRFAGWYAVRDEAFYEESELVDGKAPTGAEVEWLEEENYFFRLSAWQERLVAYHEANPEAVAPRGRRNEVLSFIRGGLNDLSISRTSFTWGVPVPGHPGHVVYVWFDALINYITAAGYPDRPDEFATWWPAALHVVGKDIVRFHAVYWPAFLMAAGLEPPRRIFAHGWWTVEGEKMSKSLGNFIPPQQLVDTYGVDPVR